MLKKTPHDVNTKPSLRTTDLWAIQGLSSGLSPFVDLSCVLCPTFTVLCWLSCLWKPGLCYYCTLYLEGSQFWSLCVCSFLPFMMSSNISSSETPRKAAFSYSCTTLLLFFLYICIWNSFLFSFFYCIVAPYGWGLLRYLLWLCLQLLEQCVAYNEK